MQMDCPSEEALLRQRLGGMDGVAALEFNLMQRVLTVVHRDDGLAPVLEAIRALGFTPELPDHDGQLTVPPAAASQPWWPLAVAGLAAAAAEVVHWLALPEWSIASP